MGDYLLMVQTQSHLLDEQDTHVALPLWILNRHDPLEMRCPLFPRKQT
jgi:hypothetical protein